jgi:hypothetical protein
MGYTKNLKSVRPAEIKRHSGFQLHSHPTIDYLREGFFCKVDASVSGDAPKDFLRVYVYGRGRKANPTSWPAYIAKVGQKYYPNESITEQLLSRIGQLMGLRMANSRLMWVRGQLRFLSEYFLKEDESLVHGAEIFAGYLAEDREFVKQVEEMKMSQEIFTFQVVEAAVRSRFPEQADGILEDFVRLIGFDAVVGNNDRHFFNWGVITQITGARPPHFSPIYDSARALFWNTDEDGLTRFDRPGEFERFLTKYVEQSFPKTGWDGLKSPNHFKLVRRIMEERPQYRTALLQLNRKDLPDAVANLLDAAFDRLFSARRVKFIVSCIGKRLGYYNEAVTS